MLKSPKAVLGLMTKLWPPMQPEGQTDSRSEVMTTATIDRVRAFEGRLERVDEGLVHLGQTVQGAGKNLASADERLSRLDNRLSAIEKDLAYIMTNSVNKNDVSEIVEEIVKGLEGKIVSCSWR